MQLLLLDVVAFCFKPTDIRLQDEAIETAAAALCREDCSFLYKREIVGG